MKLACLALLCLALAPQEAPKPGATFNAKPYKLNSYVEELPTLADLSGKERVLFSEADKLPIVLVFWGYRDPVSLFYHPHLAKLAETYAGKAAFYLVDSNYDELVSSGDALAKLREVVEREKVTLPVLIDRDNRLADDFNAIANGQVFLIDGNRFLRYHGGVDDDPRGERRKTETPLRNWLEDALTEVLAGKRPKDPWTRPAGRPIKRVPKALDGQGPK